MSFLIRIRDLLFTNAERWLEPRLAELPLRSAVDSGIKGLKSLHRQLRDWTRPHKPAQLSSSREASRQYRMVPRSGYSVGSSGSDGAGAGDGYIFAQIGSLSTVPKRMLLSRMVGSEPSFMMTLFSPPLTTEPLSVPLAR
jgi:hypothetical protein